MASNLSVVRSDLDQGRARRDALRAPFIDLDDAGDDDRGARSRLGATARVHFHAAPLIGRVDELRTALAQLDAGGLLSILGPPGIGKTAFARELAAQAARTPVLTGCRTVWLDLAGVRRADALRSRLALAFGVDPRRATDEATLAKQLAGQRLGSAGPGFGSASAVVDRRLGLPTKAATQPTLVVLDGVTDLARADGDALAGLVNTLLRAAGDVRILTTTEAPLGVAGEHVIMLGPLTEKDADELFADAADAFEPATNDGSAPFAQARIARLGGSPLAILLAARRGRGASPSLSPSPSPVMTSAIDANDGAIDAPSLAADALADLTPAAELMFAWLAYFPSGMPDGLAAAIFGEGAAATRGELLDAGLIAELGTDSAFGPQPGGSAWRSEPQRRLIVPNALRPLARQRAARLSAPSRTALLTTSFAALAGLVRGPRGDLDRIAAAHLIERGVREQPNVRALLRALRRAGAGNPLSAPFSEASVRLADRLADALVPFAQWMLLAGLPGAAIEAASDAKRWLETHAGGAPLASAIRAIGDAHRRTDRLGDATTSYEQARLLYVALEDQPGEAATLYALGDVFARTDRRKEAELAFRSALALYQASEDRLGEANAQRALGDVFARADRLNDAELAYERALACARTFGSLLGEANGCRALADVYVRTDRLRAAEATYDEARNLYRAIDNRLGEANTIKALGDIYARTGRAAAAERAYEEALQIACADGNRLGEANAQRALGDAHVRAARLEEAERAYDRALYLYQLLGNALGKANTRKALGDLYVRTARLHDAELAYERALASYEAIESRLGEGNVKKAMGDVHARQGRFASAEAAYDEALRVYQAIGNRLGYANAQKAMGDLFARTARLDQAEEAYRRALPSFRDIENGLGEASTRKAIGDLLVRTERAPEAAAEYTRARELFEASGDRLGEANTLGSFGGLALAEGDAAGAFARHLEALTIHREIENDLGVAVEHVHLGRAALAADRPLRAASLFGRAVEQFASLDDRFDLLIALRDLARALLRLGREEESAAALLLAWFHAAAIEHPFASEMAEATGAEAPAPELAAGSAGLLNEVIAACDEALASAGEDAYAAIA